MSVLQSLVENWPILLAIVLGVAAFIELRRGETVPALVLGALALALVGIKVTWGMLIAIAALAFFLTWVLGGKSVLGGLLAILALIVVLRLAVPGLAWSGKEGVAEADSILGGKQVAFNAPEFPLGSGGVVAPPTGGWTWGEQVPQVTPEVRVECQVVDSALGKWFAAVPLRPAEWNAGTRVAPEEAFCEVGPCANCTWKQPPAEDWPLRCSHPQGGQWQGAVNGVLARALGGKPNAVVQFVGTAEWPQSLLVCRTLESGQMQAPPTPTPPPQQEGQQQGQTCLTLETATARTGPSSAYPQLPDVPSGTQVQVIARKADERGFSYNGSTERCLLYQPNNAWVHCGVLSCSTQTP